MPVVVKPFKVGSVEVGGGELFLIAGPCIVESETHALKMAHAIRLIADRVGVPYIFKASYDKANRTSINAYRGPGIDEGRYSAAFETTRTCVLTDSTRPRARAAAEGPMCSKSRPSFRDRLTSSLK
jgi:2-dehydro-3-deoxyphosphooctonate aldolase (KDO 8-P synthase)